MKNKIMKLFHRHKYIYFRQELIEDDCIQVWYEKCKCDYEREWYRW